MNNNKQLLVDVISFDYSKELINESLRNNPETNLIVKGILQRANSKNQNGRVYPEETLKKAAQIYNESFIKERRALGELDHPNSEIVNLKNVSHNILSLWWDGSDLCGEIEILSTPSGNILKELFKSNIRLGVSSRALGSVKKISESTDEVQDDLNIVCWDFISNPSVKGAFVFPEKQLQESIKNPITNKWESVEIIIRDIISEIR